MNSPVKTKPKQLNPSVNETATRVAQAAERSLYTSSYFALRRVTCTYDEGILTLHGCVPSFHLKQVAQTIVRRIDEVVQIDNRLEVMVGQVWDESSTDGSQSKR